MIRLRAKSLGGSEHILVGYAKNRQSVKFSSADQGQAILSKNGWTDIAEEISREMVDGLWRVKWSDQRVTFNADGDSVIIDPTAKVE